jgi:hypothetical protein
MANVSDTAEGTAPIVEKTSPMLVAFLVPLSIIR